MGKPMHRRSCTSMWTPIAGAVFVPADMFAERGEVVWLWGLGDSSGLSA
jgi:hypothetical protein